MGPRAQSPGDTPVQYVKGVGPRRAEQFERLGITTVSELLMLIPRRYEDRNAFTPLREVKIGEVVTVQGKVVAGQWVRPSYGKGYFEAKVRDDSGVITCRWFGAAYLKDLLQAGVEIVAYGKVSRSKGAMLLSHPDFELAKERAEDESLNLNRWVPVYPLTEQLTQRALRRIMWNALEKYAGELEDYLPEALRTRRGLMPLAEALQLVHFPDELKQAFSARRRLVFDEFFLAQLVVARRRQQLMAIPHCGLIFERKLTDAFLESLSFKLTGAQDRVIKEIEQDLRSDFPMNRMLQGDVGSGKTVVAAAAILDIIEAGGQAALMAPTEILAVQHFQLFSAYLTSLGYESALISGEMKVAERRNALSGLRSGRIKLAVGTHAMIYDQVSFERLDLVVVDEQHKFGVEQRSKLYEKAARPNFLVMSATPIPRTLAMTVYGDLDVSTIDELPANRREIVTRVIGEDKLPDAYGFIRQQVAKGRQAYMIYPLVEDSDVLELESATSMYEKLSKNWLKACRVGLIHGRMPALEKNRIMHDFKMHNLDVLVSTTVVEVGVDVPNANVMLIANAERFGLAQLHQLRGRIGRGSFKSFCVLQGMPKSEDSWRRLKIMEETQDGFRIAEEDLNIRGMGNLLGGEQSGFSGFRIGNPLKDGDTLQEARIEAQILVEMDPKGKSKELKPLWKQVVKFARKIESFAGVG